MRGVLIAGFAATVALCALPSGAQTVRPAVVEYQGIARGRYELVNDGLFPLRVVLEPRGFHVDENGDLTDEPFDTSNVDLKLSAMSFRIPPMSTYTVFYEARAKRLPAWFMVLGAMTGARTDNGINLRLELPHVVYLLQKAALRREAVKVTGFTYNAAERKAVLELENSSASLGRVIGSEMSTTGKRGAPFGGFPLFPQSRRRVEVPWEGTGEPDRVLLRFATFTIDERRKAAEY